jgi:hypothetical protein
MTETLLGSEQAVDWNAVGALGQWAAALATVAAVIVALWIASREGKVRLKIQANAGMYEKRERDKGISGTSKVVFLEVINRGRRPVSITELGFLLPNGEVIYSELSFQSLNDEHLPYRLGDLDSYITWCSAPDLVLALKRHGFTNKVDLVPFVRDASGKRHKARPWEADPSSLFA